MDLTTILLRVIHIMGGAFWFGAAAMLAFFIEPTVSATGREGGAFMRHLSVQRKLPIVIAIGSVLNILAGGILYWRASDGLSSRWITSDPGVGFTVGAVAAIVAWVIGFGVSRPAIDRMGAASARVMAGDASAEAEVAACSRRLHVAGLAGFYLLAIAVAAMAAARYL